MSKVIGILGGGFKPVTKGHFETVSKALKENPEIDKFLISVGSGVRDNITQDISLKIWNIYKKYLPNKVIIEPSKTQPIRDVYNLAKENPNDTIYWFLGAREGNEDDLDDISKRTKSVDKYPNIEVKVITTNDNTVSGTKARKSLLSGDENDFYYYLPDVLTDEEKKQVYDIASSSLQEEINECLFLLTEDKKKFSIKGGIQKMKESWKKFVAALKSEGKETKEAFKLVVQSVKGEKDLSKEEKKQIGDQLKDVLKTIGYVGVFSLPGGSIFLMLAKFLKLNKYILPSSFQSLEEMLNKQYLNENATYSNHIDYKDKIIELTQYYRSKYPEYPLPKLKLIHGDSSNAKNFFGKTAYYDPNTQTIVLYTEGRHPKDIARSYSHEYIHHIQNVENRLGNITTQNTNEDDHLQNLEKEAYLDGNINFRNWTDSLNENTNQSNEKATKIFVMKSPYTPKKWNYDHIGFVLSNGMLKDMSGHRYDKDQPMPPMTYKYEDTEELFNMPKDKNEAIKKGLYKEKQLPKPIEIPSKIVCDIKDPNKKAENCGSFVKIILSNNNIETTKSNKPEDIFKSLNENLTEGRYDSITNQISSEIFKTWKQQIEDGKPHGELETSFEFEGEDINVAAYLVFDEKTDKLINDSGADSENDFINIAIQINPNSLPQAWSEISMELKDTLRHEIEHLTHGSGFAPVKESKKLNVQDLAYKQIPGLLEKGINYGLAHFRGFMKSSYKWSGPKDRNEFFDFIENIKGEIKRVPLSSIKPSQSGNDYKNSSSEYEAEEFQKILDGEKNIEDHRKEDFYPILVNKRDNKILDGNHRHYALSAINSPYAVVLYVDVPKQYLNEKSDVIDISNIQEKQEVINLWDKRTKALGLPSLKSLEEQLIEPFKRMSQQDILNILEGKTINELELKSNKEIKYWALHSGLFSKLRLNSESYNDLKNKLKGERLDALEYFYDILQKGELNQ